MGLLNKTGSLIFFSIISISILLGYSSNFGLELMLELTTL